jgi:hypothetical protein
MPDTALAAKDWVAVIKHCGEIPNHGIVTKREGITLKSYPE